MDKIESVVKKTKQITKIFDEKEIIEREREEKKNVGREEKERVCEEWIHKKYRGFAYQKE